MRKELVVGLKFMGCGIYEGCRNVYYFYVILKNDVWNKNKNGYLGLSCVCYRYYLNFFIRYLFFMKY